MSRVQVTLPSDASDEEIASILRTIAAGIENGLKRGKVCGGFVWKLED